MNYIKKTCMFFLLGGMVMLLFGCGKNKKNVGPDSQPSNTAETPTIEITVLNQINTADIWVIPDIEKNRKTTVWGTATLSKLDVETGTVAYISESSDGMYLIRMIDENQMFYSADAVQLENNQSIVIREDAESRITIIEVYDAQGTKISEYEMFAGRL